MLNGAAPPFALEGGIALALLRGLAVAALISRFGTLAFQRLVLPHVAQRAPIQAVERRLSELTRGSAAVGLAALAGWLVAESGEIAGADGWRQTLAAIPPVLADTRFGHVVMLQAVALGLSLVGRPVAVWAALAALLLQAGHGHALAMQDGPSLLLAAGLLHLGGAGLWLGGVLPLAIVVRLAPAAAGALACRWFSPVGKLGVALVAGSAAVQAWVMIGGLPGLVGTAYGWVALTKLALLVVLLGFAWLNRYRLAPALLDGATAKRVLLRSLALQTACGLLVVAAAAALSSLPPAMHEQAVWPFTERVSLAAVTEDADFRREVIGALLLLAGAAALLLLAVLLRHRVRWLALPVAALAVWLAIPHLDLLFVPAYPTSFYQSPAGFAADSILRGAELYPAHCASCHGAAGRGDGPAAMTRGVPPADLTAAHLWMHSDGELFWWLTHGMDDPEGQGLSMPGFAAVLSEDDRWALIDYIRAHNAGLATGWPAPIRAPGFSAACADGEKALDALGGGFVRLVIGVAAPLPGVTTVLAGAPASARPAPGLCIAEDTTLPRAYAILAGRPAEAVAGAQFLIDGAGWLRAKQLPGATTWDDPARLAADVRQFAAHPVTEGGMDAGMAM